MDCQAGYHIDVTDAFYGRDDVTRCTSLPENSTQSTNASCTVSGTLDRIKQQCDNETNCYVDVMEQDLDPDAECSDVFKFLRVTFVCVCKSIMLLLRPRCCNCYVIARDLYMRY